ncbi:MAG: hypothetical protein WBC16_03340, partial [Candidatus Omnitrophota bacterium]
MVKKNLRPLYKIAALVTLFCFLFSGVPLSALEAKEKEGKVAEYLTKAKGYLDEHKFSSAGSYTRRALNLDPENKKACQMLGEIEREKEQWEAAKQKQRVEADAKRKAEIEAQKQAREQDRAAKEKALAEEKAKRVAEKEAVQKAREQERAAKEKARAEAEAKRKAEI